MSTTEAPGGGEEAVGCKAEPEKALESAESVGWTWGHKPQRGAWRRGGSSGRQGRAGERSESAESVGWSWGHKPERGGGRREEEVQQ